MDLDAAWIGAAAGAGAGLAIGLVAQKTAADPPRVVFTKTERFFVLSPYFGDAWHV